MRVSVLYTLCTFTYAGHAMVVVPIGVRIFVVVFLSRHISNFVAPTFPGYCFNGLRVCGVSINLSCASRDGRTELGAN